MEYRPVRTVRELWRLDYDAFQAGYAFAEHCSEKIDPNRVGRSFFLGWIHGSHDRGRIPLDADVQAIHADMDLNMGHSEWVH